MASAPPSFYGDTPHVGELPMPGNPNAPIAEGANALSGAISQAVQTDMETKLSVARINRERQLQTATGDIAAKLATMHGQLLTDIDGLRNQSQPGAAGYLDAVNQRVDQFRDDAMALTGDDPELRSRFVDNIATMAAGVRTEESHWAAVQSAGKSVTDSSDLQDTLTSNIRTAVVKGTYNDQMLKDADALDAKAIDALPIPGTKKEEMIKDRHDARLITRIDAQIDVDPHQVVADLDAGKYGELSDKLLEPLRNKARVMADHLDTKAKEAANEQDGIARAHAENVIEDVKAGTIVDPTVLAGFRATFAPSQKPEDIKLVHSLDDAISRNTTNAKYDTATNDARRAALAEIETHKGWENDPKLVIAHTQLQALISRDDQASEKDPLTLYQRQTGQAIGALNMADPKAMSQRFIVADRAAQRYNRQLPMIFTEAEANDLRQQYNQATPQGKAQLIETLGAYGSTRARQMMAQIAPTKPDLIRLAELSSSADPSVKSIVAEAADGSAVPLKEGIAAAVRAQAAREYGTALARLPGDRQQGILQVASWIYAHRAAQAGKTQVFDPDIARASIGAALGGNGAKGGVGSRNGENVVLPMGSTQDDFDRVLTMGAAHPDVLRGAANGVPQWGGRDMHQREFTGLVPVLIQDTGSQALYAFRSRGGSGYVKTNNGRDDYVVDVRKLASGLRGNFNQQLAAVGYKRY